jgi:ribonuclease HI
MKPTRSCEAYVDGASLGNPGPAGVGVVLRDGARPARRLAKPIGETTNNVAEYLALLYAMQEGLREGCQELTVHTDSELLARQVNGLYQVRDAQLKLLHDLVLHLAHAYRQFHIQHVPRTQNREADRLAGQAARKAKAGVGADPLTL